MPYRSVNVSCDCGVAHNRRADISIVTSPGQGKDAEGRNQRLKGFHDEEGLLLRNESGKVGLGLQLKGELGTTEMAAEEGDEVGGKVRKRGGKRIYGRSGRWRARQAAHGEGNHVPPRYGRGKAHGCCLVADRGAQHRQSAVLNKSTSLSMHINHIEGLDSMCRPR